MGDMDKFSLPYKVLPPLFADLARLGKTFEAYRVSLNITQTEVARKAGISRPTLSRLERTGNATLDTVLRVLRALDLGDRLFYLMPDAKSDPFDHLFEKRIRARGKMDSGRPKRKIKWGDEE